MKHIILMSALAVAITACAQDNVVIRGYVLDKDNSQPLSLCAVQILNTQLGALTEDNGFFELPVPKVNLNDSLKISFIGYLPKTMSVRNYKQGDTLKIYLETQVVTKQEAVIVASSARVVLLHAIDSLRRNLFRDSLIATGFYRQMHEENGKFVRLIEADVNVAFNIKPPADYSLHEEVQVNKLRRSENYETNGDTHGDHFVDLLKENPFSYNRATFLNRRNIDFFASKFESEDSLGYVIKTQYKERSSAKLEQAKIWIEKGTYAISRIEIEKYPNPYYMPGKYAPETRWKLVNETDVIKLEKYKGKFVLSSIERVYNHHVLNKQTGEVDYIVQESFDLYFYHYESAGVQAALQKGKYFGFTSLYTAAYKYDESLWKNYAMLNQHPLNEQMKKDLEHAKSLEAQFSEVGK